MDQYNPKELHFRGRLPGSPYGFHPDEVEKWHKDGKRAAHQQEHVPSARLSSSSAGREEAAALHTSFDQTARRALPSAHTSGLFLSLGSWHTLFPVVSVTGSLKTFVWEASLSCYITKLTECKDIIWCLKLMFWNRCPSVPDSMLSCSLVTSLTSKPGALSTALVPNKSGLGSPFWQTFFY